MIGGAQIVSLGDDCTSAYQIRRYSGQTESGIYDWLITPSGALEAQIVSDFRDFFRRENLQIREGGDGVLDVSNGIIFHHAFTRNAAGAVTQDRLDAEYEKVHGKYQHLIGKWRALMQASELRFVRATRFDDAGHERLLDLLARRFSRADVRLLFFRRGLPASRRTAGRVLIWDVPDDAGEAPDFWQGNDANWNGAFRAFAEQHAGGAAPVSGVSD